MISFEDQILGVVSPYVVQGVVEAVLIVTPYFLAVLAAAELREVLIEIAPIFVKLTPKLNGNALL